jgi:peptidoglycan/xylan/chitin deacetylase (PgdA/CDA1 family)
MNILRTALSLASPGGTQGRLSVFIFHRVLAEPDPIFPDEADARSFSRILGWIKSWFNVLPLDVAVDRLKQHKLPPRAAVITFDDGYADNRTIALPILQQHGLTATFFIATGFLDGGRMWNDTVIESVRLCQKDSLDLTPLELGRHNIATTSAKRNAIQSIIGKIKYLPVAERVKLSDEIAKVAGARLPDNLMMTSAQLIEMRAAGMQIGAHTVSHPILASIAPEQAREEISASKNSLEQLLGKKITLFAYPNGKPGVDYKPEHAALVRELGFDAAVSTAWGAASSSADVYQLPRFTPWDKSRLRFGVRLLRNIWSR